MFKLKIHLHGVESRELELRQGAEYVFGRSSSCDVQLDDQKGISRTHFKVFDDNGQWTVQVMSKFGAISHSGNQVQTLSLDDGTVFQLADYTFQFLDAAHASAENALVPLQMASGQSEAYDNSHDGHGQAIAKPPASLPEFEGNDEMTRVIAVQPEIPYLRVVDGSGTEETIKLEGRKWLAGREESCEILLNDRKASRRQFELSSTPQGYFIRDLGSSNGTLLNGFPLASDELKPIRSGDVIQVGGIALHFEVRDPHFEKKLMVVPSAVRTDAPIVVQNPYELINYPVISGPGGAVRVDTSSRGGLMAYVMGDDLKDEGQKKKRKFMVAVATVVVLLVIIVNLGGEDPKKAQKKLPPQAEAFQKLSPKQQQQVRETFILAKNLYLQQKHALAADQLAKIHEILPEGYENSIAMANECKDAKAQKEQLEFILDQQRKEAENKRIVDATVKKCAPIAARSYSPDEIKGCLGAALELDPSNPQAIEQISRVEKRLEERNMALQQQEQYRIAIDKGRALYAKAEKIEKDGDPHDAIEAYKKHVASAFPDPGGLKTKSKERVLALEKAISTKIDEALREAEEAYTKQQNYKVAIDKINDAKALEPTNDKAAELHARIRREVHIKMKEIYEEAVIFEGVGDVEQAKLKWKKILDTDHPSGDYYKKARQKLRQYGAI